MIDSTLLHDKFALKFVHCHDFLLEKLTSEELCYVLGL